jgi:hypothetical protein
MSAVCLAFCQMKAVAMRGVDRAAAAEKPHPENR